ncbi:hypothetical protein ABTK26_19880, partial [Acinetobacter baumannii]
MAGKAAPVAAPIEEQDAVAVVADGNAVAHAAALLTPQAQPSGAAAPEASPTTSKAYRQLRAQIHQQVLRRLDIEALDRLAPERLR